jgi:hypothetical protein
MFGSIPATILAIIYVIYTVLNVTLAVRDKSFNSGFVVAMFLWLAIALLIVYDTACLTSGQCTAWSWIRTVLYAIIPILLIITFMNTLTQVPAEEEKKV